MANCDVQTSYGGLKVSELNQESIVAFSEAQAKNLDRTDFGRF